MKLLPILNTIFFLHVDYNTINNEMHVNEFKTHRDTMSSLKTNRLLSIFFFFFFLTNDHIHIIWYVITKGWITKVNEMCMCMQFVI